MGLDCAPDLVTQAPLYCHGWVRAPAKISTPLGPDSEIGLTTKQGPLGWRSGACRQKYQQRGLIALVYRCEGHLRIELREKRPSPSVFIEGAGPPGLTFP